MASLLNLARLAALVAIFGFFLPWAEVSCSGQPLADETGVQLITGGAGASASGHHDLWVAASFVLVLVGLAGSLLASGSRAAAILAAATLAAAISSLIGVAQEAPNAEFQAPLAAAPAGGGLVRFKLEYGYFISLAGLIVAISAAGLAAAGRRSSNGAPG